MCDIQLDELLSINEAAALLRVTPSAIRAWLSKGRLPRVKAGRRTLVARPNLLAFLTVSRPLDRTEERSRIEEVEREVSPSECSLNAMGGGI